MLNEGVSAVLSRVRKVHGYEDAEKHPEVVAASKVWRAAYERAEELCPVIIRANLAEFGVEDMDVTVVLMSGGGITELGRQQGKLSEFCGLLPYGIAVPLGLKLTQYSLRMPVFLDDVQIGVIDSDGDFNYTAAPSLREALAWKLATDGGRVRMLKGLLDIEHSTQSILHCIRTRGTSSQVFFDVFGSLLREIFDHKTGSRFGDGHYGARTTLWQVATRELGCEHEGYRFCY